MQILLWNTCKSLIFFSQCSNKRTKKMRAVVVFCTRKSMNFFGAVYAFFRAPLVCDNYLGALCCVFCTFCTDTDTHAPRGSQTKMYLLGRGCDFLIARTAQKNHNEHPLLAIVWPFVDRQATFDPQLYQLASKKRKTQLENQHSAGAGEKLKKKKTIFTHSQPQIKLGFICEQGKVMQIFGFPRKCIHLRRSINRQTLSLAWEIKKITHAEIETHTLNPIPFDIPLNPHLIIHSPHIMHLASAQLFCSRSA